MAADLLEWLDAVAAAQDNAVDAAQTIVDQISEDTNWWDDGDVADKALDMAIEVREAELQVAASVDEFFDGLADIMDTKTPSSPTDVDEFLRGLDDVSNPIPVFSRPAEQYRYGRSIGEDDAAAKRRAKLRRKRLVDQNTSLARRGAYRKNLQQIGVTTYRRMLHPELSGTGPCGLCVVASSRIYNSADLLPLHNGCVCGVLPILPNDDPGKQINDTDLGKIYDAAGSNRREDLQRTRVDIQNHGEVGPVLVRVGDSFLTDREAALPRAARIESEIRVLTFRLSSLESAVRGGADSGAPLAWVQNRLRFLRGI